ncbi:hypothetical protein CR203_16530 [Salipaludibacillus neizhouensis]|uniref:YtxH domain-containing protein n=1 Tax=Salipaludibacillus neizhouensis TaxID=885475 RepID=A0A3A9K939_9BACI|nr:hypothetical protein [Salipaludibacillus neizhouensis]RKL66163.1 hypothetical protein CR203_16530 [Salipaludibacillus neizhouensis]
MSEQSKKWVIGGSIIGVLSGAIIIASNDKTRNGVTSFVSSTTLQTKHWITVINENRDTVVDQLRASSEKVSKVVEAASEDIQTIVDSSQNLKSHAYDLLNAIIDSKDELIELKEKLQTVESLPEAEGNVYKLHQ